MDSQILQYKLQKLHNINSKPHNMGCQEPCHDMDSESLTTWISKTSQHKFLRNYNINSREPHDINSRHIKHRFPKPDLTSQILYNVGSREPHDMDFQEPHNMDFRESHNIDKFPRDYNISFLEITIDIGFEGVL